MFEARVPRINGEPLTDERPQAQKKSGRLDEEKPAEPLKYFYAAGLPGPYQNPPLMVDYDADIVFKPWRDMLFESLLRVKGLRDLLTYETCMIQRNIEDALEIQNPICQYQLRDVVYIHNQIVRHSKDIYCKGYEVAQKKDERLIAMEDSDDEGRKKRDSDEESVSEDGPPEDEMCPVKSIMKLLGN